MLKYEVICTKAQTQIDPVKVHQGWGKVRKLEPKLELTSRSKKLNVEDTNEQELQ